TERQDLDGTGSVNGTGAFQDWATDAVNRAVGYPGTQLPRLPLDDHKRVIPNTKGRVAASATQPGPAGPELGQGIYATGWIKRGPVGLIGHTKGDALETIGHILDDRAAGVLTEPVYPDESAIVDLLDSKGVDYVDWEGYHRVEAAEKAAGEAEGRERIKLATREAMLEEARGHVTAETVGQPASGH